MKTPRKLFSVFLALAMLFAMAIPASAASDKTGRQLYPTGDWGNGPRLTLKGVTAERATPDMELNYCYDVEVGGSLVLDMPFPAGKNRNYTIMAAGVGISPDFTYSGDNGQSWNLPKGCAGGDYTERDGKTQYVYNFTASDTGKVDGLDKAIYMHIYWDESQDPNADHADDSGSVYFYIHVVPAESKPATVGGFTDVAASSPYAEAIQWAVKEGITNGKTATAFAPSETCTVRQILTFLWRANGKPGAKAGTSDLDTAVSWGVKNRMINDPVYASEPCLRTQAVYFLWKAAGSPKPSKPVSFRDVDPAAPNADAIAWAVEKGVTNGTSTTEFSPYAVCTRGQIVTFLYRADSK